MVEPFHQWQCQCMNGEVLCQTSEWMLAPLGTLEAQKIDFLDKMMMKKMKMLVN